MSSATMSSKPDSKSAAIQRLKILDCFAHVNTIKQDRGSSFDRLVSEKWELFTGGPGALRMATLVRGRSIFAWASFNSIWLRTSSNNCGSTTKLRLSVHRVQMQISNPDRLCGRLCLIFPTIPMTERTLHAQNNIAQQKHESCATGARAG